MEGARIARIALAWALTLVGLPAGPVAAFEPPRPGDPGDAQLATSPVLEPGDLENQWFAIGDFRGSATSGFVESLNNALFAHENEGELYQDLGDLNLGLGFDIDPVKVDWDVAFSGRVVVDHGRIESGSVLTGEDLSGYRILTNLVSRGRMRINYVEDLVGKADLGVRLEQGTSMAWARRAPHTVFGDRPLEEVLTEVGERVRDPIRSYAPEDPSILYHATEGFASLVGNIAGGVRRRFADTERAALFYATYADPLTLFIDLGVPVEASLFTAEDENLTVGDVVTHTTFAGVSPIWIRVKEGALSFFRSSFNQFFRFLRETTIEKQAGGIALVRVRDTFNRGVEIVPVRIRPEIDLFSIIRVGYTMGNIQWDRFRETTSDITYRFDLNTERGMETFQRILGQGRRVTMKPAIEAAMEGDGVEILDTTMRVGKQTDFLRRARLFGLFDYSDTEIATTHLVTRGDREMREITRVRNRRFSKSLGSNARRQSLTSILVQGDVGGLPTGARASDGGVQFVAELTTNIRNNYATRETVARTTRTIAQVLGIPGDRTLQAVEDLGIDGTTRFFLDLQLSFSEEQLEAVSQASEDEVWIVVARFLLGSEFRDVWSTPEQRSQWRLGATVPGTARHISYFYDRYRAEHGELSVAQQFGLVPRAAGTQQLFERARRLVRRFSRVKGLMQKGDCLDCVVRAYSKWRDVAIVQALLVRFGGGVEDGGVGFRLEAYTEESLSPVILTNDISYVYRPELEEGPNVTQPVTVFRDIKRNYWQDRGRNLVGGEVSFQDADARLRGGTLLVNTNVLSKEPGPIHEPCLKIRLYSDLIFADDVTLRVDLRDQQAAKGDLTRIAGRSGFGRPHSIRDTPLRTSQYYYEVPLRLPEDLRGGAPYTVLLRGLNAEGLPVTEEQEIRFRMPSNWYAFALPRQCPVPEAVVRGPSIAATPASWGDPLASLAPTHRDSTRGR